MLAIASYVSRPFPLHNAKCFILLYGFQQVFLGWRDVVGACVGCNQKENRAVA